MENKTVAEVIDRLVAKRDCDSKDIADVFGRLGEALSDCRVMDSCPECRKKWYGFLAEMIEEDKTKAVSAAMERTMAEQMTEWAVESGLPAFNYGEDFGQWLKRCFLRRPLYDDGEPVQFEDKISHRETGETVEVFNMNLFSDGDFVLGFRWDEAGSSLYGKGERVKRPAPKVLDADGTPIEVGETVWDTVSGIGGVVDNFQSIYGHDTTANIECPDDGKFYNFNVDRLTHKEPDTQERIDAEALLYYTEYWRCGGIDCDKCPAVDEDGKRPNKRYGTFGSCTKAMLLDLLRRQRELDARKGGE